MQKHIENLVRTKYAMDGEIESRSKAYGELQEKKGLLALWNRLILFVQEQWQGWPAAMPVNDWNCAIFPDHFAMAAFPFFDPSPNSHGDLSVEPILPTNIIGMGWKKGYSISLEEIRGRNWRNEQNGRSPGTLHLARADAVCVKLGAIPIYFAMEGKNRAPYCLEHYPVQTLSYVVRPGYFPAAAELEIRRGPWFGCARLRRGKEEKPLPLLNDTIPILEAYGVPRGRALTLWEELRTRCEVRQIITRLYGRVGLGSRYHKDRNLVRRLLRAFCRSHDGM